MNTLSLFNGMSVCQMAMIDAGIEGGAHYISEIDKYANKASKALFSDQIQLGDVTQWRDWDIDWSSIELVTGGFPCQAWSMAGKQLGDKDERGMLFWTMLDIIKHVRHHNPKAHFLIENVKMKKEFEEYITTHTENALGEVHKILINSALVSAQNRNRYYWTSFPVTQPKDEGIVLADIIEVDPLEVTVMSDKFTTRNAHILRDDVSGKGKCLSAGEYVKNGRQGDYINVKCARVVGRKINPETGKRDDYNPDLKAVQRVEPRLDDKSECLTTVQKDNVIVMKQVARGFNKGFEKEVEKTPTLTKNSWEQNNKIKTDGDKQYRKLTPSECMRLQTIPEHYIEILLSSGISNTQLYKMTGNAWTMKVISHILSCMPIDKA